MYDFAPMMPFYNRFVASPPGWLASADGRRLVGRSVWLCRRKYGKAEAWRYYVAVIVLVIADGVATGVMKPKVQPNYLPKDFPFHTTGVS